jgi:hypothetical protein
MTGAAIDLIIIATAIRMLGGPSNYEPVNEKPLPPWSEATLRRTTMENAMHITVSRHLGRCDDRPDTATSLVRRGQKRQHADE